MGYPHAVWPISAFLKRRRPRGGGPEGTRLTPDSESQENSDLSQNVKRVPGLVFFDVILTYLRLFRDIFYFGLHRSLFSSTSTLAELLLPRSNRHLLT